MLDNFELVGEWDSDATGNKVGLRRIDMESVMRHFTTFDGPVLHIGSKAADLDTTSRWRRVFAGKQVIGIDIEEGDNVDHVFDITQNISNLRKKTGIKQYSTIVAYHLGTGLSCLSGRLLADFLFRFTPTVQQTGL